MKYQVLTADKTEDVTLEIAQAALAAEYPDHDVEVHDGGHQFIAKLTSKLAADDEEDDDAPAPSGKKPPFLEEKEDADGDDDGDEKAPPKKKPADDDGDDDDDADGDEGDKDDLGFQDPDAGVSDVVKALKAVKTLEHTLPKLKDQLKGLNGGDDLGGDLGPDGAGPGGPGGPGGLPVPPPPPGPSKGVGPTPGAPPGAALPGGGGPPGPPGGGIKAPNVQHGLDLRKGPQVGPSTFSHIQDKILTRPVDNGDGTRSTLLQATAAIEENPRYANYYVDEVKYDSETDQWVARLKSR